MIKIGGPTDKKPLSQTGIIEYQIKKHNLFVAISGKVTVNNPPKNKLITSTFLK